MGGDEAKAVDSDGYLAAYRRRSSLPSVCSTSTSESSTGLDIFVRLLSEGRTVLVKARPNDTVRSLLKAIQTRSKINPYEQLLIHMNKPMKRENYLTDYNIQNGAELYLVSSLGSVKCLKFWLVIDDIVSVHVMSNVDPTSFGRLYYNFVELKLNELLDVIRRVNDEHVSDILRMFTSSSAPEALFLLYASPDLYNKKFAENSIRKILGLYKDLSAPKFSGDLEFVVLQFCALIAEVSQENDPLCLHCKEILNVVSGREFKEEELFKSLKTKIVPDLRNLAKKLSEDMVSAMVSATSKGISRHDVLQLKSISIYVRGKLMNSFSLPLNVSKTACRNSGFGEVFECIHEIVINLLDNVDSCLVKKDSQLSLKENEKVKRIRSEWRRYLDILRELHRISELFKGVEEKFQRVLWNRKASFCALIVGCTKTFSNYEWILDYKGLTDFETRRHLAMIMFPEVEDYEELTEHNGRLRRMIIDRSNLLAESFQYVSNADPDLLDGTFITFKNERASGPGVLREWFLLVCQAIFNPLTGLFLACPDDRRRFYPNAASTADPLHLKYFRFAGRVIALALMHKVQVGIVLDRVFFLRLAGTCVSLEDIKITDPCLYKSCKQILEMDADWMDSGALGLTFVREFEELGERKVVELAEDGDNIAVNSKNREKYINLLIRHCFVESISEQVSCFARGFGDILAKRTQQQLFFQNLELEDLDQMLCGADGVIDVGDWKAHTKYGRYKKTDPQILWFWKIVDEMSGKRRKALLFFWTSVNYLPVEGFRGLESHLRISKSFCSTARLPTSQTCFYELYLPLYPSLNVMRERLSVIAQDHVSSSFGNT